MILSLACSNSFMLTVRLSAFAENKAASLTRLAKSAPENPGVPRAKILALTSSPKGTLRI